MSHDIRQLNYHARTLNFAGPSRTPGGLLYIDHAQGTLIELFQAVIVRTGMHFSLARVEANPNLGTVRIDAPAFGGQPPAVGARFLIGPLQFTPRPQASFAYPLNGSFSGRPTAARREYGTVCEVSQGYGFIRSDAGQKVFAHAGQFERGAQLLVGMRVSFDLHHNAKGPTAQSVRPATN